MILNHKNKFWKFNTENFLLNPSPIDDVIVAKLSDEIFENVPSNLNLDDILKFENSKTILIFYLYEDHIRFSIIEKNTKKLKRLDLSKAQVDAIMKAWYV